MPIPTSPIDISCVILISKSKYWAANELPKQKKINYHINGIYKTIFYKTESNFSQFFFSHWLLDKRFFSFLIKAFANFEKLIRCHWLAFVVYKNGENSKMQTEIFCQKFIVSKIILAFLHHLKPKRFFVGQLVEDKECHLFSKSLDPPLLTIKKMCYETYVQKTVNTSLNVQITLKLTAFSPSPHWQ